MNRERRKNARFVNLEEIERIAFSEGREPDPAPKPVQGDDGQITICLEKTCAPECDGRDRPGTLPQATGTAPRSSQELQREIDKIDPRGTKEPFAGR